MSEKSPDSEQACAEATPEMIEAGVRAVVEFFPYAWGSETRGIS